MKVLELITDAGTGLLSHTKLWTHVAYFTATLAFLRMTLFMPEPAGVEIWMIYLGVVGGHSYMSKRLSMQHKDKK